MIRREIVSRLAPRLSPDGFKILVDVILSSHGGLEIVETPYVFRKRQAGESKLSPLVGLDFLGLVVASRDRRRCCRSVSCCSPRSAQSASSCISSC